MSLALPDMDMDAAEPDYGPDGPAAHARWSKMVTIRGEWRGSAARDGGVEVRRYIDATTFDVMHSQGQISDAQCRAASRLYRMWTQAGLNPKESAGYGRVGGEACIADDEETSLDIYRDVIRPFRGPRADLMEGVMLGRHPGTQRLPTYHAALDVLVDEWGLRDCDVGEDE